MKKLGINYWRLWTASVVSNFGDGVASVAYPWLASVVTRDPVQIALIGVATRLPWLIFTLPAGVITDRVDRRRLVAVMDIFRFLLTVAVALIVLANQEVLTGSGFILGTLYVSALLFGFAEVLRDNAAQTLMPSVVQKEMLETANGRLWGAEMVMNSFVGPPLGGFLIAIAFALPFFVDGATFAVAAILILTLSGEFRPRGQTTSGKIAWRSEMGEGLRWLWNHRLLRSLGISLGVLNGVSMAAFSIYVLFVQEILGLDATGFGLMASAAAVGGVLGSFTAARVSKRLGSGTSLFVVVLSNALGMLIIGLTSSALVVWAMIGFTAYAAVVWNVITVSLRQTIIPDHLLGRVNSVYRMLGWGSMPIGSLLGGVLVSVTIFFTGDRLLGLRMPFFVATGAYLWLFVYALPRLNTRQIEQARAEAEAASAG